MGTTLTHNVYLPDEGERNCYSGLANNWQILDDAVGAIAGKANASHTHGNISNDGAIGSTSGLPIITGTDGVLTTGSFGNTAGTFCEGNDSRLSDARTPVAHTHVTADVTDLLSGDHTWTGDNTFSGTLTGTLTGLASQATSDASGNVITDTYATLTALSTLSDTVDTKADDSDVVHKTGDETVNGSKTFTNDGHFNNVFPNSSGTYNLGTSTYKWNSGWIGNAELNYIGLHTDKKTKGVAPSDSGRHNTSIVFRDTNNSLLGKFEHNCYSSGDSELLLQTLNSYSNGSLDPNGTEYDCSIRLQLTSTGQRNFAPTETNLINLGTTAKQWNNLYAKNYYYNGTQWGLDQVNRWTGSNTYTSYIKSIGQYRSDIWSGNARDNLYLMATRDTEDVSGWLVNTFRSNVAQGTSTHIYGWDVLENGTRYSGLRFNMDWDSTLNDGSGGYKIIIRPNFQGANPCTDLHIEYLKSINGINPGVLSFPDMSQSTDIKPYITNVSGAASANLYTPAVDGWIMVKATAGASYSIYIYDREAVNDGMAASAYGNGSQGSGRLVVLMPVRAGRQIGVICILGSLSDLHSACFFPNLGNV